MTTIDLELAKAKQADLRETARLHRCCGRGALRRATKARRSTR